MPFPDDLLICPACRKPLPALSERTASDIQCRQCPRTVPLVRGVPRFVESDRYVGNFSFEWTIHAGTQLDSRDSQESEATFREKTGFDPADLAGKLILDAGCGMGRFADVASRWGANVVGVDLSAAVDSAWKNLGDRTNVRIVQADLFDLPFAPGTFDIIYSLGVLHHTPDCKRAFETLLPLLKPGGVIAIWVYGHMGAFTKFSDVYRRVTTRLPPRLLYALCHLAVPLYWLYRIPILGRPFQTMFPISMHPRAAWRLLDTFDWYSPRYQSKHTWVEVFRWFKAARLVDIDLLDAPVALRGRKAQAADRADR